MESLQLVVNHPWFGLADTDSTVLCLSQHGLGSHQEPGTVRPIFSKISQKAYLHFIMCHIPVVPRGNGFSQETIFFRSNRQETIHDAWCYNIFLQRSTRPDRQGGLKWMRRGSALDIGARFLDIEKRVLEISLVLAKDVQDWDSFQPRLHLRVLWDMDVRAYNPSGYLTSATCIALCPVKQ